MNDFREQIQEEVDNNFGYFKKELPRLMPGHQGQYALLKNATMIEFVADKIIHILNQVA